VIPRAPTRAPRPRCVSPRGSTISCAERRKFVVNRVEARGTKRLCPDSPTTTNACREVRFRDIRPLLRSLKKVGMDVFPGLPPRAIICPPHPRLNTSVAPIRMPADALRALWGSPLQGLRVSIDALLRHYLTLYFLLARSAYLRPLGAICLLSKKSLPLHHSNIKEKFP
jgi:hypothetical protein